MKQANIFFGSSCLLLITGCNEPLAYANIKGNKQLPDFLLILTDDQSYHLSHVGTPGIQTPSLDNLARGGVFFTKAYAAAASCSPCRSVILTGMYPHSNGHWRNTVTPLMTDPDKAFSRESSKADPVGVHEDLPTLVEILNAQNYVTGITEKFHLSPPWKYPFTYHFPAGNTPSSQYQAAVDFFKKSEGRPFFLEVNIGNTHRPFRSSVKQAGLAAVSPDEVVIPPNWPDTPTTREDFAEYLSTVEQADAVAGEVLKALKESGRAENTIVIYTSDQGFCYHRAKATTYDQGVHVPLSFTGKGIIAGKNSDALVSHTDLVPTILDLAGLKIPATVQGKSLKNLLTGKTGQSGHEFIFSEHNAHGPAPEEYYPTRTVTDGRFRYIRNLRHEIIPDYPIERFVTDKAFADKPKGLAWICLDATPGGNWGNRAFADIVVNREKFPVQYNLLVATFFRPAEELYDLENDPFEMKNLAEDVRFASDRNRLSMALDTWMRETGDDGDPRSHPRRTGL